MSNMHVYMYTRQCISVSILSLATGWLSWPEIVDSKGVLRVYTEQFGGSWLPLFSASKIKKPDENYWVVGLSSEKLFCIICKTPDLYPKVSSKPILSLLDLSFPLASSDLGSDALENEFIMRNMQLSQIQKRIDEAECNCS